MSRHVDTERVGFDGADVEAVEVAQVEEAKAELAEAFELDGHVGEDEEGALFVVDIPETIKGRCKTARQTVGNELWGFLVVCTDKCGLHE